MEDKVAVVTGANKGIGYAIVRGLSKKVKTVYLTARDANKGNEAIELLSKEGLQAKFHQLDIENKESIDKFAAYLKDTHKAIDVLVNNAGMAYKHDNPTPFHIQAEHTMRVNFFGTLDVCNALFPLLRSHARVVNVSSRSGLLKIIKNDDIIKKLSNENATIEDVIDVMNDFVKTAKHNQHEQFGYPHSAYGMSKVGVTAITRIQQKLFDEKKHQEDIVINAVCPGYVDTEMTSHKGHLTIDQGAETSLYLALLPDNIKSPRGELVAEKTIIKWFDATPIKE